MHAALRCVYGISHSSANIKYNVLICCANGNVGVGMAREWEWF